jgi:uncharacterized protein YcbK (DUF882 family)
MSEEFLRTLEHFRHHLGRPVFLTSAYRSPADNRRVGGAVRSQHLLGLAVDLAPQSRPDVGWLRSLHIFSGLGLVGSQVLHVDARHLGPWANGADVHHPATWSY